MPKGPEQVSRRQFTGSITATVAGTLLLMDDSAAQTRPATDATTQPALDPRIEQIEKSRSVPLSAEMRDAVLNAIRDNDRAAEKARASFVVPDQTEPAVIFKPTPHA